MKKTQIRDNALLPCKFSHLSARNICPRVKIHIFRIGDCPRGYTVPCYIYVFGKLSSSQCYNHLTCNAATYRFRDIRGQSLGLGVSPKRGEDTPGTHVSSCKISRRSMAPAPRYLTRRHRKMERITGSGINCIRADANIGVRHCRCVGHALLPSVETSGESHGR